MQHRRRLRVVDRRDPVRDVAQDFDVGRDVIFVSQGFQPLADTAPASPPP